MTCRSVPLKYPGPEDIVLHAGEGAPRLIVSSAKRGRKGLGGWLLQVPLTSGGELGPAVPLLPEHEQHSPVGLSLVSDGSAEPTLWAIFRRKQEDAYVQAFRLRSDTLETIGEPLRSDTLVGPNDLHATPDGHVYVTNDRSARSGWHPSVWGDFLGLPLTRVAHYRADRNPKWQTLPFRVAFGNGILTDPEGSRLIVASFRGRKLLVFDRRPDGSVDVASRRVVRLNGYPDNLTWDPATGDLLVAAHRSLLRTSAHLLWKPTVRAPWMVYRIAREHLESPPRERPEPIECDCGAALAAVSVAVPHGGRLYLGQIVLPGIGICEEPPTVRTADSR